MQDRPAWYEHPCLDKAVKHREMEPIVKENHIKDLFDNEIFLV